MNFTHTHDPKGDHGTMRLKFLTGGDGRGRLEMTPSSEVDRKILADLPEVAGVMVAQRTGENSGRITWGEGKDARCIDLRAQTQTEQHAIDALLPLNSYGLVVRREGETVRIGLEPLTTAEPGDEGDVDYAAMTKAQLQTLAAEREVDVSKAKRHADYVQALVDAEADEDDVELAETEPLTQS